MTFEQARATCLRDEAAEERARLYASARRAFLCGHSPLEWLDSEDLHRVARSGVAAREVNAIVAMVWGLP